MHVFIYTALVLSIGRDGGMVDANDSKSFEVTHESSSLSPGTKTNEVSFGLGSTQTILCAWETRKAERCRVSRRDRELGPCGKMCGDTF
ncbi:MAG: hypothetical protein JWO50_563 [Candidatus Kaiserbacteria bacterium]|nr:hypothetical protein [Candidatus Kaiserbacteria bacterium]